MNLTNISTLKPFGRFCVSLGMLPTSYKESMSYEEQLIWLCRYIETEVIPKYNENVETINELIVLYNQLKEYVDNYFENLDVQEEINNKLDDMAESGELAEIITAYLEMNGVLAYDVITDLTAAENIVEGSTAYTLGHLEYNDGKGGFYKIRQKTEADVIDGFNIVSLNISNELIAERLPNYYINEINSSITTINNEINDLNDTTEYQLGLINNNNNIPNFSNNFGMTNNTLLSEAGHKYIEPFVIYDKDHNKYLMFFSDCTSSYAIKRAESSNMFSWSVVDNNVIYDNPTERHKFNILCNVKGEPVKLQNKYHAYAVSKTPKRIYHYETTDLTAKWTETGVALDYNNNSTDNYGVDAPCIVYDEINKNYIMYYMGLSSTTNTSYINRAESNKPDEDFEFKQTILSPTASTWYSGWLGGMQVLQTTEGLKVVFNGSVSVPNAPGAEPDPSNIGIGTMNSLYSTIKANNFPSLITVPDSIDAGSVWRGHVVFNPVINKYMMFYNTGYVNGNEVITYALNDFNSFESTTAQYLTTTDPVLIGKCMHYVTPGFYNIKLTAKCAIGSGTGMKVFKVKVRIGQDTDLTTISSSDHLITERNVYIGNYAYQNENIVIDVFFLNSTPTYKKIYATVELEEGDATNEPTIQNVRYYITQL